MHSMMSQVVLKIFSLFAVGFLSSLKSPHNLHGIRVCPYLISILCQCLEYILNEVLRDNTC